MYGEKIDFVENNSNLFKEYPYTKKNQRKSLKKSQKNNLYNNQKKNNLKKNNRKKKNQ